MGFSLALIGYLKKDQLLYIAFEMKLLNDGFLITLNILETVIFIRPLRNMYPRAAYSNSSLAPSSVRYSKIEGVTAASILLRTMVGLLLSPVRIFQIDLKLIGIIIIGSYVHRPVPSSGSPIYRSW